MKDGQEESKYLYILDKFVVQYTITDPQVAENEADNATIGDSASGNSTLDGNATADGNATTTAAEHREIVTGDPAPHKSYTFMLIFPAEVIEDKMNRVTDAVMRDVLWYFILPFAAFSFVMMIIISISLNKISVQITVPIIELYKNIQAIISANQREKEELIKG